MKLITKAKEILIAAWDGDTAPTLTAAQSLTRVIADTLSINQDDAEEQTFEFETTDTPETFFTAGAYQVDLNNAEISDEWLEQIMGWEKIETPVEGVVSPETYETRYIALQVKFAEDFYIYLPKIAIAPKLVFESIKTSLAYGTLSGTAANGPIGDLNRAVGIIHAPILKTTA